MNWDEALADAIKPNKLTTGSACLTDFGESFQMATPPTDLGTPQVYCAPEQILEQKISKGCDLWALGCTLFEIRTGRKLFDTFDDDADEYLCKVASLLGKYPEPWWTETWSMRSQFLRIVQTLLEELLRSAGSQLLVPRMLSRHRAMMGYTR